MKSQPSRNQSEIERSASEARRVALEPLDRAQIDRYIAPPADTPFALEYAFHLLGDVRGKTVLDLGCGSGENLVVLLKRGARVIGMDISPDLIKIAQDRLTNAGLEASVSTGDACHTGLPDGSVDVIFCMALIHHLDIDTVREEMWRILRKGGCIVLKEPVRFSRLYQRLRSLLPDREEISDYEHPLTRDEMERMTRPFLVEGTRYFRLPLVPLMSAVLPSKAHAAWKMSNWVIRHVPLAERYASCVVTRLQKSDDSTAAK
jgi:SAM-dependent methyltransferase